MKRTVLTFFAVAALAGCSSDNGEGPAAAGNATAASTPAEFDPDKCQEPAYLMENMEFCANTGGVGEAEPTEAVDAEGSVTTVDGSFIQYPDGLKVTPVFVEAADPAIFREQTPGEIPMVVVTHWENVGTEPVQLAGYDTTRAVLLSGPNGFQADSYAVGGDDTSLPARVLPGTSFDYRIYYSVPDPSVLALRFTPNPDVYTIYTFNDVETLLR